jgi:hypothetical protein
VPVLQSQSPEFKPQPRKKRQSLIPKLSLLGLTQILIAIVEMLQQAIMSLLETNNENSLS